MMIRATLFTFLLTASAVSAQDATSVRLGNDPWPPFVLAGDAQGTAEQLVCEALRRGAVECVIEIREWADVLDRVAGGQLDGIAAVWRTPERDEAMVFSDPYMTNRIVAVTRAADGLDIDAAGDLAGLRVALAGGYAYGEAIDGVRNDFTALEVPDAEAAIAAVHDGRADVALADELVAQDLVGPEDDRGLVTGRDVLAQRQLYFALSRDVPRAAEIVTSFNQHYALMVQDGTVNEILDVDWLATDLGGDGVMDFVLRSAASVDDLAYVADNERMYALDSDDYDDMKHFKLGESSANYHVAGAEYNSMNDAIKKGFNSTRCIINCPREIKLR
ncbi:MAG: transporter substrate-binding domain-containing protein [Pseudomonadota bacterium]